MAKVGKLTSRYDPIVGKPDTQNVQHGGAATILVEYDMGANGTDPCEVKYGPAGSPGQPGGAGFQTAGVAGSSGGQVSYLPNEGETSRSINLPTQNTDRGAMDVYGRNAGNPAHAWNRLCGFTVV